MDVRTTITCRTCPVRQKTVESVLSLEDLDRVDKFRSFVDFSRGQTIFSQGSKLKNHFSIHEGVVRVVRSLADGRRTVVGFLFAGDLFGLSDNETYTYSTEAVTGCRICCFPIRDMQDMYNRHPALKQKLISVMNEKLNRAEQRISDLARKSSEEKLASFLASLIRQGSLTQEDGTLKLPMTREDISDYLGLSPETTSRTFTSFGKKGIISFKGKTRLIVENPKALSSLAGEVPLPDDFLQEM